MSQLGTTAASARGSRTGDEAICVGRMSDLQGPISQLLRSLGRESKLSMLMRSKSGVTPLQYFVRMTDVNKLLEWTISKFTSTCSQVMLCTRRVYQWHVSHPAVEPFATDHDTN